MNTFFVYTVKTFLRYLFFVSLLILMLLMFSSIWTLSVSLSESEYSLKELVSVAVASSLIDVNKVVPIISALAVMVTMLILMRSNELLAYMTIGGSVAKLVVPFLLIGISLSALMMYIEYSVVPSARIYKDSELNRIKYNSPTNSLTGFNNTWFVGHDEVITNIGFVSITDKKVYNVVEYMLDNNSIRNIVKIGVISKKEDGENKGQWVADSITVHNISTNPPKITHIDSRVLREGTSIWDQMVSLSTTNEKALTPKELYTMIQISKSKGINSSSYEINLYYKLASALSVIVLVLFLFPISIDFSRNYSIVKNATITFSFALVFIISQTIGKALGDKGALSPITATFGPLILFLILSVFLIYSRSRAR